MNNQLDLIYEIEGLMLLADNDSGDSAKISAINSLIDAKLQQLIADRTPVDDDREEGTPIVDTPIEEIEDMEAVADSAQYEEIELANPANADALIAQAEKDDELVIAIACDQLTDDDLHQPRPQAATQPAVATGTAAVTDQSQRHFPLTINDRFRFRRSLFGNSSEAYNHAIDRLRQLTTADEARRFITTNYPDIDLDGDEFSAFFDIITQGYDR